MTPFLKARSDSHCPKSKSPSLTMAYKALSDLWNPLTPDLTTALLPATPASLMFFKHVEHIPAWSLVHSCSLSWNVFLSDIYTPIILPSFKSLLKCFLSVKPDLTTLLTVAVYPHSFQHSESLLFFFFFYPTITFLCNLLIYLFIMSIVYCPYPLLECELQHGTDLCLWSLAYLKCLHQWLTHRSTQ